MTERTIEVEFIGGPRDRWRYRVPQVFDIHHHLPAQPYGGSWQPPSELIFGTVGSYMLEGLDDLGIPLYRWVAS